MTAKNSKKHGKSNVLVTQTQFNTHKKITKHVICTYVKIYISIYTRDIYYIYNNTHYSTAPYMNGNCINLFHATRCGS